LETRNPDAFLPYAKKRSSTVIARSAGAEFRISRFEFRISICTAYCLLPTVYCLLFLAACGYHVAGTASRIPPDVKTIAVPAFKNMSSTFHIEQQLTSAVTREFLERTHYRILPNPADADAVLKGTIKDVRARAMTFDINTGRATSLQIQVTADVQLEDVHTHKILFANSNYVYREEYQVSESPSALFEEDKPALDRLSRDLARTLVTDVLENF
jgi:outer membrane lipopolysaccharide assembly protein LptE/RlpB